MYGTVWYWSNAENPRMTIGSGYDMIHTSTRITLTSLTGQIRYIQGDIDRMSQLLWHMSSTTDLY